MHDELPALGAHLQAQGVHPSMYCSHWFITVFAYTLPFEHLLRVWDIFLFEGLKVVLPCIPGMVAAPASLQCHCWGLLTITTSVDFPRADLDVSYCPARA